MKTSLHKLRRDTREHRKNRTITPTAAANEVRKIKAGLTDIALKFNEISLAVRDTRRARKLSALALCAERASVPLAAIARDLELRP